MSTSPSSPQTSTGFELPICAQVPRAVPIEAHGVTIVYDAGPARPSAFTFSHDEEEGLFILTWADGRIGKFRDKPARQLAVEADPKSGELRPVIKNGLPVFHYLCREERELG